MEQVKSIKGSMIWFWDDSEKSAFVSQRPGIEANFLKAPDWLKSQMGWSTDRYVFWLQITNDINQFWNSYFRKAEPGTVIPGFYEIYTMGRGPLTGEEVRAVEHLFGVNIDDHSAVSSYNNELMQTQKFFKGVLSDLDVVQQLPDEATVTRFQQVHSWVASVIGAAPLYYAFETDKWVTETVTFLPEGIRHVELKDADKVPTIAVAFPGAHCRMRDVFNLSKYLGGAPIKEAEGKRAMQLPGRDRWARITGVNSFSTYLAAPHLVLSQIQVDQLFQGRSVTMPKSPVVPPYLYSMVF